MPDYLVTITRRLTIFGAVSASAAAARAIAHETDPTPTENRLGALVLRVDVEKWEAETITDA